jgi:hypothetical protein
MLQSLGAASVMKKRRAPVCTLRRSKRGVGTLPYPAQERGHRSTTEQVQEKSRSNQECRFPEFKGHRSHSTGYIDEICHLKLFKKIGRYAD